MSDWVGVMAILLALASITLALRRPRQDNHDIPFSIYDELEALRRKVDEQEALIQQQASTIESLRATIQLLRDDYRAALAREADALRQINELQDQVERMRAQVRALRERRGMDLRILGIWPETELRAMAARDALYNLGIPYQALTGHVTREDVIRELDAGDYNVVEVDSHGMRNQEPTREGIEGGILLSDGLAPPGWWGEVFRTYGQDVELVVLMACESLDVVDALVRAGVPAVVGTRRDIDDRAAAQFVLNFYRALADGDDVEQAVRAGRMVLDRDQADRIFVRMRE